MTYLKTFLGITFGKYFYSCAFQHIVCHIDECNLSVSRRSNVNNHFYFRAKDPHPKVFLKRKIKMNLEQIQKKADSV